MRDDPNRERTYGPYVEPDDGRQDRPKPQPRPAERKEQEDNDDDDDAD